MLKIIETHIALLTEGHDTSHPAYKHCPPDGGRRQAEACRTATTAGAYRTADSKLEHSCDAVSLKSPHANVNGIHSL